MAPTTERQAQVDRECIKFLEARNGRLERALTAFINTVNATGGLVRLEDGTYGLEVDPDWIDLADAYLSACNALARQPMVHS